MAFLLLRYEKFFVHTLMSNLQVVNYWSENGVSGFNVYKFRLKRLDGQPLLTTDQVFIGLTIFLTKVPNLDLSRVSTSELCLSDFYVFTYYKL